jgi:hypothetical protein
VPSGRPSPWASPREGPEPARVRCLLIFFSKATLTQLLLHQQLHPSWIKVSMNLIDMRSQVSCYIIGRNKGFFVFHSVVPAKNKQY